MKYILFIFFLFSFSISVSNAEYGDILYIKKDNIQVKENNFDFSNSISVLDKWYIVLDEWEDFLWYKKVQLSDWLVWYIDNNSYVLNKDSWFEIKWNIWMVNWLNLLRSGPSSNIFSSFPIWLLKKWTYIKIINLDYENNEWVKLIVLNSNNKWKIWYLKWSSLDLKCINQDIINKWNIYQLLFNKYDANVYCKRNKVDTIIKNEDNLESKEKRNIKEDNVENWWEKKKQYSQNSDYSYVNLWSENYKQSRWTTTQSDNNTKQVKKDFWDSWIFKSFINSNSNWWIDNSLWYILNLASDDNKGSVTQSDNTCWDISNKYWYTSMDSNIFDKIVSFWDIIIEKYWNSKIDLENTIASANNLDNSNDLNNSQKDILNLFKKYLNCNSDFDLDLNATVIDTIEIEKDYKVFKDVEYKWKPLWIWSDSYALEWCKENYDETITDVYRWVQFWVNTDKPYYYYIPESWYTYSEWTWLWWVTDMIVCWKWYTVDELKELWDNYDGETNIDIDILNWNNTIDTIEIEKDYQVFKDVEYKWEPLWVWSDSSALEWCKENYDISTTDVYRSVQFWVNIDKPYYYYIPDSWYTYSEWTWLWWVTDMIVCWNWYTVEELKELWENYEDDTNIVNNTITITTDNSNNLDDEDKVYVDFIEADWSITKVWYSSKECLSSDGTRSLDNCTSTIFNWLESLCISNDWRYLGTIYYSLKTRWNYWRGNTVPKKMCKKEFWDDAYYSSIWTTKYTAEKFNENINDASWFWYKITNIKKWVYPAVKPVNVWIINLDEDSCVDKKCTIVYEKEQVICYWRFNYPTKVFFGNVWSILVTFWHTRLRSWSAMWARIEWCKSVYWDPWNLKFDWNSINTAQYKFLWWWAFSVWDSWYGEYIKPADNFVTKSYTAPGMVEWLNRIVTAYKENGDWYTKVNCSYKEFHCDSWFKKWTSNFCSAWENTWCLNISWTVLNSDTNNPWLKIVWWAAEKTWETYPWE